MESVKLNIKVIGKDELKAKIQRLETLVEEANNLAAEISATPLELEVSD